MAESPTPGSHARAPIAERERATIRFAGDSGDGMQLAGNRFTDATALFGNDFSTLPDFPAEIRAPAGSLAGVSSFQISFSRNTIHTPGDAPDALVAMNPAALRVHAKELVRGGLLIVNADAFTGANLRKAGYTSNPLKDGSMADYRLLEVPITKLATTAAAEAGVSGQNAERTKNFFALGMIYWLYDRDLAPSIAWIEEKFARRPAIVEANTAALKAGHAYAETAELADAHVAVPPASLAPGTYRTITGNEATAIGLVAAQELSGLQLFYGSYPITPASDILHSLASYQRFGVKTFQAEDEIAAVGAAIGAAFGGSIGVTGTSGPGLALKSEAIGLAVMTELPIIVLGIQRGGPSTGLPTKTEQADLLQAMFGRNGESPVCVVAPRSPGDCFYMVMEAVRLAFAAMTPVIFLSDGYLANTAEPWPLPDVAELPRIEVRFHEDPGTFAPYARDPETLARQYAVPGTTGLQHRIGGLEKADGSGDVSYDPANHQQMVALRAEKIARIARMIPAQEVEGPPSGDVLVLSWGSTYGPAVTAVEEARAQGADVSLAHLRYLNPFPANLGDVLRGFRTVLIPENNAGQLRMLVRAKYLVDARGLNKVSGQPFSAGEITDQIMALRSARPSAVRAS
ncbi:MAG: 2-oxoacid:acceptor oxidoreductase subunit alpha [Chloroflexi bacterium]|nr:2-oxoacid:acceptor oxidoreductase subunit alpha [Chloroflexota bacterium]